MIKKVIEILKGIKMERISVLITGASGGGVGEQIIKALKLSSLNLEISDDKC